MTAQRAAFKAVPATPSVTPPMIGDWLALRTVLAELAAAEQPAVTDRHGRAWTWSSQDLYTHCGMAFPREMLDNRLGLPSQLVLDNPRYELLCAICLDGRTRHLPAPAGGSR